MLKKFYPMVSLLALTFAIGLAYPSYAQEKTSEPVNQITLKVTSPNGTWAIATVFEGEQLSMTDQKTGTGFVFVPTVTDAKTRTIDLKVFPVADAKTDEISVENLFVAMDSPKDTQAFYRVEVKGIAQHLLD